MSTDTQQRISGARPIRLPAIAVAVALAALGTGTARSAHTWRPTRRIDLAAQGDRNARETLHSCTIAAPPVRATIEVQIPDASDFCELVSHALASDVFRAPVFVTPGRLWHYAGATVSCRLRYQRTRERMTIRNSRKACRWFGRTATGWHAVGVPHRIAWHGAPG